MLQLLLQLGPVNDTSDSPRRSVVSHCAHRSGHRHWCCVLSRHGSSWCSDGCTSSLRASTRSLRHRAGGTVVARLRSLASRARSRRRRRRISRVRGVWSRCHCSASTGSRHRGRTPRGNGPPQLPPLQESVQGRAAPQHTDDGTLALSCPTRRLLCQCLGSQSVRRTHGRSCAVPLTQRATLVKPEHGGEGTSQSPQRRTLRAEEEERASKLALSRRGTGNNPGRAHTRAHTHAHAHAHAHAHTQ
jgi:hypothetical protein